MNSNFKGLLDPVGATLDRGERPATNDRNSGVERARAAPRRARFDRAFEKTVRAGYLTIPEAVQRGQRDAYAADLQSRFDLSLDLALRVTDGRMRLGNAVEERARRRAVAQAGPPVNLRRIAAILTLVVFVAVFFNASRLARLKDVVRKLERTAAAATTQAAVQPDGADSTSSGGEQSRSRVERDADEWVTRVTAAHPAEALATYCAEATPGSRCVSLDIVPVTPSFPGRRLGRFTLYIDGPTWLVPIRRDRGSGRWVIGTGLRPIVPTVQVPADGDETPGD